MRILSVVAIAVVASAGLAACATTPAPSYRSTMEPNRYEIDAERMANISTQARGRGIRVVWVNPPTKRLPANSDQN